MSCLIKLLLVLTSFATCKCLKYSSLDMTYKKAIDAYNDERWSECIVQFEESLHLYKLYKSININCRLKCNSQRVDQIVQQNIEDLQLYEKFFKTQNCITNCLEHEFEEIHMYRNVDKSIVTKLESKSPYEYLHICYFQMNALPKAASAAYTYSVAHPDDNTMKNNVEYYLDQSEVDVREVVDIESEDYMVLYGLGAKAYNQKNWGESIAAMEEVIIDYISWENGCRVQCEYNTVADSSEEFTETISNNIAQLLQCKQDCQNKLKELNFDSGIEFLAEILNFLQISYYHLDRIKDAATAVSGFLFLLPNDIDMLENKEMYMSLTNNETFIEKDNIVYYSKRDQYEKQLLNYYLIHNFQSYDNANENTI